MPVGVRLRGALCGSPGCGAGVGRERKKEEDFRSPRLRLETVPHLEALLRGETWFYSRSSGLGGCHVPALENS